MILFQMPLISPFPESIALLQLVSMKKAQEQAEPHQLSNLFYIDTKIGQARSKLMPW